MVSSGTVTSDASSLSSFMSNYKTYISDLSSSWKGASYDNLTSKADSFASEYGDTIQKEMSAFANACSLYEEYKQTKTSLENARSNYNTAVSNGDNSSASRYNSQISEYSSKLESLKREINSYLQQASSSKLEATSLTGDTAVTTDTTTTSQVLSTVGGEFINNPSKGIYGYFKSSIDGLTHAIYRQSQISGWGSSCNRAAAASIASAFASNGQAVSIAKDSSGGLGYNQTVTNKYFSNFGLKANVTRVNGSYDSIKNNIVSNLSQGNYVMFDLSQSNVVGKSGQKWTSTRHWVSVLDIKKTGSGSNDYAIFISDSGHGGSTKDYGLGTGWYSLDEFTGKKVANFTTVSKA